MRPLLVPPASLALALTACGSDDGIKVHNTAPEATIVEPADGATLPDGETVALVGVVADIDDAMPDLQVTWRIDGVEACAPTAPDADGNTRCEVDPGLGTHDVVLVVTDPDLSPGQATSSFTVVETHAPSADITAPEDGAHYVAGTLVTLEGVVADYEDGASELTVWWESTVQDLSDLDVVVDSDGAVTASTTLDIGDHALSLHVQDTDGKTASDTITLSVSKGNSPPDCSITSPADAAIFDVEDGATMTATVSDADQAPGSLDVSWSSDIDGDLGSVTADSTGLVESTLPLSLGDHTVTLTVQDTDGEVCTDNVALTMDSAPDVTITSPARGTVVDQGIPLDVTVVATDATDPEDALTATWSSDLDGVLGSGSPDSGGDLSFTLSDLSAGSHTITVEVEDTAGLSATDTLSLTVNGLPSAPVVSISPSSPVTADALTATIDTASVDPEGGAISYSYAWTADGDATPAVTATVPASSTSKGQRWEVTVTPMDSHGSAGTAATASVTIQDTPPVLTTVSLSPSSPTVDDTITANASASDADGDSVSFGYAWTVGGVAVPITAASLSTGFSKGEVVEVTVTPTADGASGDSDTASVTVVNTPPTAPVVSISPSDPYAGTDTLTCAIDSFSTDADGDDISYAVAWTVDGSDAGVSGYTVSRSATSPGEFWVCEVTPSDDEESGESGAASVTVLGDPVDYAHVQWPCSLSLGAGVDQDVYGWVYKTGVTDDVGEGAGITGQVGVGAADDDPSVDGSAWTWVDATYNDDKDGLAPGDHANDEYVGTITTPASAGSYAVVYRFSTDGGASWTYADLGDDCGGAGTTDGFDVADALLLTVTE